MIEPTPSKRHRAFISYGHAADGRLAPALQNALHRFGRPLLGARVINVFRDQTDLSISPGLWSSVQRELADSEFLILLASPAAAASKWVRKEVDFWLSHASSEKLLLVLTDGEIEYDDERHDFDWHKTTALPPNLAGAYKEVPYYLDLRWARDARTLTLRNPRFREDVADIAATLHEKPKSEMLGEDLRRRRLLRRGIAVAASAFLVLVIVAAALAVSRSEQRRLASAGQLGAAARNAVMTDPELALLLALEAVAQSANRDAVESLRDVLVRAAPRIEYGRMKSSVPPGTVAREFSAEAVSRDGSVTVKGGERPELRVEGAFMTTFDKHVADVNGVDVSPDNALIASVDQEGMGYVWEARTGKIVFTMRPENKGYGYARVLWSPDGRLLYTAAQDGYGQVWERRTWQQMATFGDGEGAADLLAISADGRRTITASTTVQYGAPVNRTASVWNALTGTREWDYGDPGMVVEEVAFTPDSRFALVDYEEATELWDPDRSERVARWDDDGLTIAADLDRSIAVLDAAGSDGSGEGVLGVERLGFSKDGRVLVTIDSGGSALLWENSSWMRFNDPTIESSLAAEVAPESPAREVLSPDGRLAIRVGETEGSGDVVVKSSGEIVATLRAGGQPVVAVAFTPDGNWVAIADGTRNVRVRRWETIAPLDMLQARARKLVTRPLTDDERNRALSAGQ